MTRGHIRPMLGNSVVRSTSGAIPAGTLRTASDIQRMRQDLVDCANSEWTQWHTEERNLVETNAAGESQVLEYWGEQNQSESQLERRTVWKVDDDGNRYQEAAGNDWVADIPWSAAFIVWCVRQAGFTADEFPNAWKHTVYTFFAKENRVNNRGVFRAYRLTEVKPQYGDIVCLNRNGGRITYDSIRPHGQSHCDIVTDVTGTTMTTIGGNVFQNVGRREVTLEATGHLPARTMTTRPEDERGAGRTQRKNYFAVLRFHAVGTVPVGLVTGDLQTQLTDGAPASIHDHQNQVRGAIRRGGGPRMRFFDLE